MGERATKFVSTSGVQFKGDDARAPRHQRVRDRAGSRADIQDQVASGDTGVINEPFGPPAIESVPSPSCPFPGHGVPS
jgi:hypothetical protein